MKISILNTTDTEGGAARCAYRLHKGLLNNGVESKYLVKKKISNDSDVTGDQSWGTRVLNELRPGVDRIPLRLYKSRTLTPFSTGLINNYSISKINATKPDVVNLHYISEGYLPLTTIAQIEKPVVWTLHDSWPFTGGCHLPGDCTKYTSECGKCPQLNSKYNYDLTTYIFNKKQQLWKNLDLTIITDGAWLAECARKSSLFKDLRIETINPGLPLNIYKPTPKLLAREMLNLPLNKKLILFGAMRSTTDVNKGFHLLNTALESLENDNILIDTELVIFGASKNPRDKISKIKSHYIGRLYDDISLSLLYSAADMMIVPSLRESFGQTASEALACGTPVVAFAATGLLDIVEHKYNGYLATPYDPLDLANGIRWILMQNEAQRVTLNTNSRKSAVNKFSIQLMSEKYISIFQSLIK